MHMTRGAGPGPWLLGLRKPGVCPIMTTNPGLCGHVCEMEWRSPPWTVKT